MTDYVPNTVPIEFGITMRWRSTFIVHMLKKSSGIGGMGTTDGGLRKPVMKFVINFANTRVPRYTAIILFLEVIAYTLDEIVSISRTISADTMYLNMTKMSEAKKKNATENTWKEYPAMHLGGGKTLARSPHLPTRQTSDPSHIL